MCLATRPGQRAMRRWVCLHAHQLTRAFVLAVLQCIDDGWYGCIEDSQCCTAGFFCNDGYCQ